MYYKIAFDKENLFRKSTNENKEKKYFFSFLYTWKDLFDSFHLFLSWFYLLLLIIQTGRAFFLLCRILCAHYAVNKSQNEKNRQKTLSIFFSKTWIQFITTHYNYYFTFFCFCLGSLPLFFYCSNSFIPHLFSFFSVSCCCIASHALQHQT